MMLAVTVLKGTTFLGTKYARDTDLDVSAEHAKEMVTHGVAVWPERAVRMGDRFAAILQQWLTPAEFAQMQARNAFDPRYGERACASHDFCDANMAMAQAFTETVGREIDAAVSADAALWASAWESARERQIARVEQIIDWDDPAARGALIERVGAAEYERALRAHVRASTVAVVNGYRIRAVGSRFGRLFQVDGGEPIRAFATVPEADGHARSLPPKGPEQ